MVNIYTTGLQLIIVISTSTNNSHHPQIASLRSQLDARTQRNALLEIRLLALLDALDELQASSVQELAEAQRENGRLSRKLDAANAALRASEGEKERMGKAVMHLVHKGLLIQRLKVLSSSDFCS